MVVVVGGCARTTALALATAPAQWAGGCDHPSKHVQGSDQMLEQRTHIDGLTGCYELQGNKASKQALLEPG